RLGARSSSGHVLPHRERARHADQRFRRDEGDSREMRVAEPRIAHPLPAERRADPDADQPADDEEHEREVDDQDRVGDHPGVMFAWRITSHFARSLFMNAAKSSGALPTGTWPSPSSQSRTSGTAIAFTTSSRRRWIA